MIKLVFVTGAGRGIGRTIALHLAKMGYEVAGCSRTMQQLEETKTLSEGAISIAAVDVTSPQAVEEWITSTTKKTSAQPWALISAAGIYGPIGSFLENDWTAWKDGLEINLYGTFHPVRSFSQLLIRAKLPGRIVLLSGGGATQPLPNFTSYCASKAAVVRFGETAALELKDFNITLNSIAPGAVNTQLTEELIAAGPEKAGAKMYANALKQKETGGANPERAAGLAAYLLGSDAAGVTGRLISAIWDPWEQLHRKNFIADSAETYTLRRVVPPEGAL